MYRTEMSPSSEATDIVINSGARVFPVDPANKAPHIKAWQTKATDNPAVITAWWRKWPKALIGVATGEPSGLWGLDIDDKSGGPASLAELIAVHGALPETAHYRTPGGCRYMFRWPKGTAIKSRTGDKSGIAPGIDVRGGTADGRSTGYVIVPPGVRADGGRYDWHGCEGLWTAADAPAWLLFLAVFGRREREALATLGITAETASEVFAGLPVAGWYGEARKRLEAASDRASPAERPLDRELSPAELQRRADYVRRAVQRECQALGLAESGGRQSAIGSAGLSIHSLLKGLDGCGGPDLEDYAYERWLEARDALGEGEHTAEDPAERWERCRADAEPRDLRGKGGTAAEDEFEVIPPEPVAERKAKAPGLIAHRGDSFDPEAIQWFWRHRIASGKLHLVAGYGDVGKTTLLLSTAATFTCGGAWPDGAGNAPLGSVLYFSTEDDKKDTLLPRFMAAGGDRPKVYFVSGVQRDDGKGQRGFKYGEDLAKLEAFIDDVGDVRAVYMDPLNAYFGGTNSWHNSDVRGVLEPLADMAARKRVAIIGNTHFSKGSAASANMKVLDSVGIVNLARLVYIVTRDPDDETGSKRLFLPNKYNIAPDTKGLDFHIEERTVDAAKGITGTRVVWDGCNVDAKADDVLARLAKGDKGPSAFDDAVDWLRAFLAGGPKPHADVIDHAVNSGMHKERTIDRAKKWLAVKSVKDAVTGGWSWALPNGPTRAEDEFENLDAPPAAENDDA